MDTSFSLQTNYRKKNSDDSVKDIYTSKTLTEDYYSVEKVLDKRIRVNAKGKKVYMYKIKWKGYSNSYNSWEPEENITEDLIEDFNSTQKQTKTIKALSDSGNNLVLFDDGKSRKNVNFESSPLLKKKRGKVSRSSLLPPREMEIDNEVRSDKISNVFQKKRSKKQTAAPDKEKKDENYSPPQKKRSMLTKLVAKRIIGVTEYNGKPVFLMEWEGSAEPDFVFSEHANKHCPKLVIKFYEENLNWRKQAVVK